MICDIPMKNTTMRVRFQWRTPALGHQWKRSGRALRLVPQSSPRRLDPKKRDGMWSYTPPVGLFRKFARLRIADGKEVWRRDIRAFADAYGDIIAQPQDLLERLTTIVEIIRKQATEETWCRTIQHMRRAVDLWDAINDRTRSEVLQRLIVRNKGGITYRLVHHPLEKRGYGDNDSYKVIATAKNLADYPLEDLLRPARKALQLEIQDALTDTETPSHATPYLTPEARLVTSPVNLLAYMWLTFARVVSGEIQERRCAMCSEHFYVGSGPGLRRADSLTCGDACRQQKSRQGRQI